MFTTSKFYKKLPLTPSEIYVFRSLLFTFHKCAKITMQYVNMPKGRNITRVCKNIRNSE